jgi:uncharacterized protein
MTITRNLIHAILAQYPLPKFGVHGLGHWARVRENGLRLAERTGAQIAVVELFAYLHDAKRINDGGDPEHGRRGGALARSLYADPERMGMLDLSREQFDLLVYACAHHTDGLTEADVTVQTCWDADRLDLGRVGIRPEPERLCTPAAQYPATIEWAWKRSRQGRVWTLDHHHS